MGGLMELRPGPPLSALFLVLCAHASVSSSQLLPCGMSRSLHKKAMAVTSHGQHDDLARPCTGSGGAGVVLESAVPQWWAPDNRPRMP